MIHSLRSTALLLVAGLVLAACADGRSEATTYVCPPCAPHDTLRFEHDGECPICGMNLTEKPDSSHIGPAHLHEGSGTFLMRGGPGHEETLLPVYYHRPEDFTQASPILIVVPGAGRDGWDYRDAWVEASERHGVLILSPRYPEEPYGFADYHMGGVVEATNIEEVADFIEGSHEVVLDEERLTVEVNAQRQEWLFGDFDRLFEAVAPSGRATTSSGTRPGDRFSTASSSSTPTRRPTGSWRRTRAFTRSRTWRRPCRLGWEARRWRRKTSQPRSSGI